MYKRKTHSGAAKRFKKLKSGLIKARHQGLRHILTKKTRKNQRFLGKTFYLSAPDAARITQVL